MEHKKSSFPQRAVALTVITLGWVLCAYLFFRYTQLENNAGTATNLCKVVFGRSCDGTLTSSNSWQLGFPLVGWGMAYFGMLGLLFSFRSKVVDRFVLLLAAFGTGVSCVLTVILFRSTLVCPLCYIIHFINLVALIAIFLSARTSIYFNEPKPALVRRSHLTWGLLLLFLIISGGFTEVQIFKSTIPEIPKIDFDEVAKKFQSEQVYNFPKNDYSPHLGSIEAPVQLVVFSSFQCPSCKGFASSIENLQKKFGKNVCITFKNFPLSTTCNPGLVENMQPQSCSAAYAALAAHQQNRFWEYHDRLFQSDLSFHDTTLVSIARNIELDMEKWEQDRHSEELKKHLMEDLKSAYKSKINATPTVFINGRKVSQLNERVLNLLIQNELNKTASN